MLTFTYISMMQGQITLKIDIRYQSWNLQAALSKTDTFVAQWTAHVVAVFVLWRK